MQKLEQSSNQNHSQPRKAMFLPQRILKTTIKKLQTLCIYIYIYIYILYIYLLYIYIYIIYMSFV